jgi:hypothetical protein
MMQTLRNRKTGRKSARRRFTKRDVGPRPPFLRISQARSGSRMQISKRLLASKPECDAHVCLNLGFTSQNFRLTQASRHVCYFWSSPFGMDEWDTLPGEPGLCHFKSSLCNQKVFCPFVHLAGRYKSRPAVRASLNLFLHILRG